MLRYLRSMGGCIGLYNRASRESDTSEESSFATHNRPLKHRKPKWKSNIRLTESQLNAKREEFWDTAPAFEGRKEIWDALRASVNALEVGDYQMAQVILDGANVSLPNGTLMDCYDELGNHYQLPVYVLSAPVNLIHKGEEKSSEETADAKDGASPSATFASKKHWPSKDREEIGREIPIRIRFSNGDDYRLMVNSTDLVASVKCSLVRCLAGVDPANLRFFFAGKQLSNNCTLASAKIDSNYTIQAAVSEPGSTLVSNDAHHKQSHKHSKHRGKHSKLESKHFKLVSGLRPENSDGQRCSVQGNCKPMANQTTSDSGATFFRLGCSDAERRDAKDEFLSSKHPQQPNSNHSVLFELPT